MEYSDANGRIKYEVETLINENGKPSAIILSEAKGSEMPISSELIEKAASSIFQSNGEQTVFLEKENGNYTEFRVSVGTDPADETKFKAEIIAKPIECSPNMVEFFRDKAALIISTDNERKIDISKNEDIVLKN